MKIAKYALAALGLIAFLTPTAKADSFVYQVTSTDGNIDVIFDLPSFQENVTTSTFTTATSAFGPITEFNLSGNSTGCVLGGTSLSPGPCFIALIGLAVNSISDDVRVPSFTGPGTFTATNNNGLTTTVTITEVSTVPEPSSLALIPPGLVALLVMRKRMGHNSPAVA